jgi:hypothetical protein
MAGFGIAKKGLGLLGKKRKTLTISGPSTPKKRTVIIKKPSTTKLADTWQNRRIDAINRKIKNYKGSKAYIAPDYAQEATDVYGSKASTKKSYKANQKKFYSLPEKERDKIWKIKSKRALKGK